VTNRNLIANAMQVAAWFSAGSHRSEKLLGAIPLFQWLWCRRGSPPVMCLAVVGGGRLFGGGCRRYQPAPEIGAILQRLMEPRASRRALSNHLSNTQREHRTCVMGGWYEESEHVERGGIKVRRLCVCCALWSAGRLEDVWSVSPISGRGLEYCR